MYDGSAVHYRVCEDSHTLVPHLRLPLCPSISTQVTEQEALTMWYARTHTSPIHPRGELTLGQWDEWTVFLSGGDWLLSPAVWGFGQEESSWGQWGLGSTWTGHGGKEGGQEWGQFGCTNEDPRGTNHHCPMAPSIFWGPGQPLGWADWGLAWQWGPRT